MYALPAPYMACNANTCVCTGLAVVLRQHRLCCRAPKHTPACDTGALQGRRPCSLALQAEAATLPAPPSSTSLNPDPGRFLLCALDSAPAASGAGTSAALSPSAPDTEASPGAVPPPSDLDQAAPSAAPSPAWPMPPPASLPASSRACNRKVLCRHLNGMPPLSPLV